MYTTAFDSISTGFNIIDNSFGSGTKIHKLHFINDENKLNEIIDKFFDTLI